MWSILQVMVFSAVLALIATAFPGQAEDALQVAIR